MFQSNRVPLVHRDRFRVDRHKSSLSLDIHRGYKPFQALEFVRTVDDNPFTDQEITTDTSIESFCGIEVSSLFPKDGDDLRAVVGPPKSRVGQVVREIRHQGSVRCQPLVYKTNRNDGFADFVAAVPVRR